MKKSERLGRLLRVAGTIERQSVDEKSRRVPITFSSEEPVRREFMFSEPVNEILDHSGSSVRLGRLNAGANVLMHHDRREIIGVVEKASVGPDRRGHAEIRFGKDVRGSEAFDNVLDGILQNVSVGYKIHAARLEESEKKGEPDTLRATDWEPVELSLVSVPADASVGVGRQEDPDQTETVITMPKDSKPIESVEKRSDETVVELAPVHADKIRAEEGKRRDAIDTIASGFPDNAEIQVQAEAAKANFRSIDQFRADIMPILASKMGEVLAPRIPQGEPRSNLGMSDTQAKEYSLFRAIKALIAMRGFDATGDPRKIAPFEIECSNAVADQMDREAKGLFIPYDVQQRTSWVADPRMMLRAYEMGLIQRTPPMGVATTGTVAAALKGTDHLAASFIEALRPATIAIQAGAIMLPGLVGDVDIPKQTGLASWTWLAEDADGTDTEVAIGAVSMAPKTISAPVPITRRLIKQSAPGVEQLVRNDLVLGAGEVIDLGVLEGSGAAGQPTGIVNTTGVNTQTIADITTPKLPTWTETVGFETACATDNALRASSVWLTTPAIRGGMKTTEKATGTAQFIWTDNQEVNGYPGLVSTQLTTDRIIFGGFNQVIIGMWGTLDINIDTATKAASGGLVLRPFQDLDVGIRHIESFCINA